MTPNRRHLAAARWGAGMLISLALLAACGDDESSSPTPPPTVPSPVAQVLADNQVTYDLRQPPTREEVGLAPGQAQLAIDHPGGEPLIDVTVILPGDTRLEAAAGVINISAIGENDPDPDTLELVRTFASVDEAVAELNSRIDILALDPGSIDRWASWANTFMDEGGTASGATFASRAFTNTSYEGVILSASTAAFADTGVVRVHYHLTWGVDWG